MSDITMCTNAKCPISDICYRGIGRPGQHSQSWARFEPKLNARFPDKEILECDYFIPTTQQSLLKQENT